MTPKPKNNAPSHRVYIVKGEGESALWREIGVAWANQDGKGYALSLDAMPLTARSKKYWFI